MIFLDANIILRFVCEDDPELSPQAKNIFEKINQSNIKYFVSSMAFFEVVFTLERTYKFSKEEICNKILPIIKLDNVILDKKETYERALMFYKEKNVSFADAFQVSLMIKKKVKRIYSFDPHFDRFPQIKRLVD